MILQIFILGNLSGHCRERQGSLVVQALVSAKKEQPLPELVAGEGV